MSKAFTKEADGEDDAEEEFPARPAHAGARYITKAGYQKLERELQQLWKVERPKVTQEVSDAAAQGDRSENAEYIYGKRRLREIDRRIRYLSKLLDDLTIVEADASQRGRVFFGARVTIEDEDGKRSTYRIVGPDETDFSRGDISVESPVAKALIGRRVGDDVIVNRPKGPTEIVVLDIAYDGIEAAVGPSAPRRRATAKAARAPAKKARPRRTS